MRMNLTENITRRFLAPQIPEAILGKDLSGKKMFGIPKPDLLRRIKSHHGLLNLCDNVTYSASMANGGVS